MLHIGHSAEGGEDAGHRAAEAERPGGDGKGGFPLLELRGHGHGDVAQASAEQGLHYDHGDAPGDQLLIGILRAVVAVVPVDIVHLYLAEVPMIGVVKGEHLIQALLGAVERESEVADAARHALLQQEVHQAVVQETLPESRLAGDIVEQIVIYVVGVVVAQRAPVHRHALLIRRLEAAVVGALGGNVITVAGMAGQGLGRGRLALPLEIYRSGVEVIDSVRDGVIHHLVDLLLVDHLVASLVPDHGPAHAAVAEERDLVAGIGIGAQRHPFGHLRALPLLLRSGLAGGRGAQRDGARARLDEFPSGNVFHGSVPTGSPA